MARRKIVKKKRKKCIQKIRCAKDLLLIEISDGTIIKFTKSDAMVVYKVYLETIRRDLKREQKRKKVEKKGAPF